LTLMTNKEKRFPIDLGKRTLSLSFEDTSWPKTAGECHDRLIARAVVLDGDKLVFAHIDRHDAFADYGYLETSGGGIKDGEDLVMGLRRELKEELGYEVEIICYLGKVVDYYNAIARRNINHYFLVRKTKEVHNHLMDDEKNDFHLYPAHVSFEEAIKDYSSHQKEKLGALLFQREVPVINLAHDVIDSYGLV
jgi:8-oxo-dGTP diphosphatase